MRRLALSVFVVTAAAASCGVGLGEGELTGHVNIPLCRIDRAYTMETTFFATNRVGREMAVRIQNGGGSAEFDDNFDLAIDDTDEVSRRLEASDERDANGNRVLTLPVGPDGEVGTLVHAQFAPRRSCGRTKVTVSGQLVALRAYEGTITFRAIDRGPGDPERRTEVTAIHLLLHDTRPVGDPAPARIDPDTAIGDAEFHGWFRFHWDRASPAQNFP